MLVGDWLQGIRQHNGRGSSHGCLRQLPPRRRGRSSAFHAFRRRLMPVRAGPRQRVAALTVYYVMRIGTVPLIPYPAPGELDLARVVDECASRHPAVPLASHGPVVAGKTLDDAVRATEELEETARLFRPRPQGSADASPDPGAGRRPPSALSVRRPGQITRVFAQGPTTSGSGTAGRRCRPCRPERAGRQRRFRRVPPGK